MIPARWLGHAWTYPLIAAGVVAAILWLCGCRNDAITYAHGLDPRASCSAIRTYTERSSGEDTAVCRFAGRVWFCTPTGCTEQTVIPAPAEAPR